MAKSLAGKIAVRTCLAAGLTLFATGTALSASSGYCDRQAREYANRAAPGEEVIGTAIGGGVIGAVIGGLAKGSRGIGPGAAIGGGVGAAAGLANHSAKWNDAYHYAYNRCMGGNAGYAVPAPGTDAWYKACDRKYKSFRWSDATYNPGGGKPRRVCHLP